MRLNKLLLDVEYNEMHSNDVNPEVSGLCFNSREATPGSCFVALTGTQVDGHEFAQQAVDNGATVVVCQHYPKGLHGYKVLVLHPDTHLALAQMADNFYDHPSRQLKLVGITGTNGKTTTATLLHRLFRSAGYGAGLLSTIVNKINDRETPATHTTPDALQLNRLLRQMVDEGCQYAFMEVSSHALAQDRVAGLTFAGGIFSNITHDHLDYHKTMAQYIAAKKRLFDQLPQEAFALTNADDRNGMVMVQNTAATVRTYSLQRMADYRTRILEETLQGMQLEMNGRQVWTQLVGRFNAYNLTAIYGAARLLGMEEEETLRLLSTLQPAEGRFQLVNGGGITAIVDYAHTPDALQNVLNAILHLRRDGQQVITVVGCGGDRDTTKRPEMAQIACQMSDRLILTSDNPRTEDPERILDDMQAGLTAEQQSAILRISDRRQAIRTAVALAHEGDIVLVAGKGHEKYQDIQGVKHHFDDREELEKELKTKK